MCLSTVPGDWTAIHTWSHVTPMINVHTGGQVTVVHTRPHVTLTTLATVVTATNEVAKHLKLPTSQNWRSVFMRGERWNISIDLQTSPVNPRFNPSWTSAEMYININEQCSWSVTIILMIHNNEINWTLTTQLVNHFLMTVYCLLSLAACVGGKTSSGL